MKPFGIELKPGSPRQCLDPWYFWGSHGYRITR